MMPTYCYSDERGHVIERFYPMGKQPTYFKFEGRKYERDIGAENSHRRISGDIWPVLSTGAAVHPSQIKEFRDKSIRDGVPTEFTRDGRPILRTRKHRRDYLRTRGLHDIDAGYGDY